MQCSVLAIRGAREGGWSLKCWRDGGGEGLWYLSEKLYAASLGSSDSLCISLKTREA